MTTQKTPYEACAEIAEAAGRELMARGKLQANVIAQHIADAIRATATPAWEPLTPERMAAVRKDTTRTEYWLAVGGSNEPWQACWEPVLEAFYADSEGITLRPAQVTHIMPFTTPELPS